MKQILFSILTCLALCISNAGLAASALIGKPAAPFELNNQDGKPFKLSDRKGQGYTVLFFYPAAGTPGCTKQACAFRDSIQVIRKQGAEVYGISADGVAAQKKFHDEHKMSFDLLSDTKLQAISAYGVKMAVVDKAKRQTFVLDENLVVREHFEDVDPALDAKNVAAAIARLKATPAPAKSPKKS